MANEDESADGLSDLVEKHVPSAIWFRQNGYGDLSVNQVETIRRAAMDAILERVGDLLSRSLTASTKDKFSRAFEANDEGMARRLIDVGAPDSAEVIQTVKAQMFKLLTDIPIEAKRNG